MIGAKGCGIITFLIPSRGLDISYGQAAISAIDDLGDCGNSAREAAEADIVECGPTVVGVIVCIIVVKSIIAVDVEVTTYLGCTVVVLGMKLLAGDDGLVGLEGGAVAETVVADVFHDDEGNI